MNSVDQSSAAPQKAKWRPSRKLVWIAIGLAVILWLLSGIYTVESNERAVITRFGKLFTRAGPGIGYTLPWPIDRVYTPTTTEVKRMKTGFTSRGELWSDARRSDMLTGDENILKMEMVVQYKITDPVRYLFETDEPDWLVERTVESSMANIVGSLSVDDVLTTAKAQIEIRAIEEAQKILDRYEAGISLLNGNLQIVSPPVPVIDAFNDVTRAKKDSERKIEDARMYENKVLPQARGQAGEITNRARGEARLKVNQAQGEAQGFTDLLAEYVRDKELTRKRLYLEMMERLLNNADVVIVDEDSKVTIYED
jgi:membrane protease subunit HflK